MFRKKKASAASVIDNSRFMMRLVFLIERCSIIKPFK